MERLFGQIVGNVVQYVIFKDEMRYLDTWGCKRINNSLCALLRAFQKNVHPTPSLDEFVVYYYKPCQYTCEYTIPIEDAIPALMYTVMEYGRLLNCRSLYVFHMLTKIENRFPSEEVFLEQERSLLDEEDTDHESHASAATATATILDRLTPYRLASTIPDQVCCICQEELQKGQQVISLPCMHTFHTEIKGKDECRGIHNWLQQSPCCPLCKRNVE